MDQNDKTTWMFGKDGSFKGMFIKPGGDPNDNFRSLVIVVLFVLAIAGIAKFIQFVNKMDKKTQAIIERVSPK